MEVVSNICAVIVGVSMLVTPVLFVIWLVRKLWKKPVKKLGVATLIGLASFVAFLLVGTFTDPATYCDHEYELVECEAATCEQDGFEKYHCGLCGRDKTEKLIKLGHDMVSVPCEELTHESDGEYVMQCSRCGYEEIAALEVQAKTTDSLTTPQITEASAETHNYVETEKHIEQTEEQYKNNCIEIDYKDLCRYAENYRGKSIKLIIQVKQIMNDDLLGIRKAWRAQTDNDGLGWYMDDEYYLVDKRASDAIKILEDDVLVVYGEFVGMKTVTRALTWTRDEIPEIYVEYADLMEWQTCKEIYEEYAQKMRDSVPALIAEFEKEAETNTDGIAGLAEISNNKVSVLAEIESNGTQKMAAMYSNAGETYDDYMEWAGKLWDVYMEEAAKVQDAYINYATG